MRVSTKTVQHKNKRTMILQYISQKKINKLREASWSFYEIFNKKYDEFVLID